MNINSNQNKIEIIIYFMAYYIYIFIPLIYTSIHSYTPVFESKIFCCYYNYTIYFSYYNYYSKLNHTAKHIVFINKMIPDSIK